MARLSGWWNTKMVYQRMVTHPSTSPARRSITLLPVVIMRRVKSMIWQCWSTVSLALSQTPAYMQDYRYGAIALHSVLFTPHLLLVLITHIHWGMARLSWRVWLVTWFILSQTVVYPSTNRAWCTVTCKFCAFLSYCCYSHVLWPS